MLPPLLAAGLLRTKGRLAEPSVWGLEISLQSELVFLFAPLLHRQKRRAVSLARLKTHVGTSTSKLVLFLQSCSPATASKTNPRLALAVEFPVVPKEGPEHPVRRRVAVRPPARQPPGMAAGAAPESRGPRGLGWPRGWPACWRWLCTAALLLPQPISPR